MSYKEYDKNKILKCSIGKMKNQYKNLPMEGNKERKDKNKKV